jgi:hypothetical protein
MYWLLLRRNMFYTTPSYLDLPEDGDLIAETCNSGEVMYEF